MMHRTRMMILLAALLSFSVLLPSPLHLQAYADIPDPVPVKEDPGTGITTDAEQQTQIAGSSKSSCSGVPEATGGALIGKIVPCIVNTIQKSTEVMTADMVSWMMPVFYAFLLLVLLFYGVRVLQKEPEIYKHGFLLLLKIAIIATILTDLGSGSSSTIIPAGYGVIADAQKIIAGAIDTTSLKCDVDKYMGAQTPRVWGMMDCIMGKLWGFTMGGDGKPSMVLVTSVAGLMTGFLFGGAWGVVVFFGMVSVLFSIFMLVVRTIIAFLIGYLIVCLMFILSPIFLPLTLMRGTTDAIFQSYWRTILRGILTPVIITAYSMFALMVYDKMLFADDSIVAKIFKYDNIKDAIQPLKKMCDRHVTNDPTEVRFDNKVTDTDRDTLFKMPFLQNLAFPTLSGGNDACNVAKLPVFKLDKMNGMKEGKDKDELVQIFMQLIELFILGYLIAAGQGMLPGIVGQLVGGSSVMRGVEAVAEAGGKYSSAFSSAQQRAINQFRKVPGDKDSGFKSGGDYIRDLPTDIRNAAKASRQSYFNTLRK